MDNEAKLNVLTAFVDHRTYIFNILNSSEKAYIEESSRKTEDSPAYIASLMAIPVSKVSKFSDSIWDFNADYPNAARNVQGSKLRLNFSKYEEIPKFVLTELKTIFYLVYLSPTSFKLNEKGGRSAGKITRKANTLTHIFEYGLAFIDEVFKHANNELGREFVQSEITTLSDILPNHYQKAAENYGRVKGPQLDKFFAYVRNPSSQKYVFANPIPYVELNSLKWKKLATKASRKKDQVLPDIVFESLSKTASLVIVDFLNAIDEEVKDAGSMNRLSASNHSWATQARLNHESFTAYTALRLRNKGYSSTYVKGQINPYDWMLNTWSEVFSNSQLRTALHERGYESDHLRLYINLVIYSCVYIVGQYTGMRPSELAEVRIQECECLAEEDGCWLIKSAVKKHVGEESTGLFDDKWVAIPIVRDAIMAASHIGKLKASPYLLSNVDTVAPEENAISMTSEGIKHQMDLFIKRVLGENAIKDIAFNPYMMRHTLTYQLFRAEVGLPLISFQLKHFVDSVSKYTSIESTSSVTLGYGDIGEMLSKDGVRSKKNDKSLRRAAELDAIKTAQNPNGVYYGGKAVEHKARLTKMFDGYMAAGYTEDEVYEAMVDQGMAIVHMGQGLCFGGKEEEFDTSLPCIGSLRCNPARCKHAIVTKQHAPKWREVYLLNKANLNKPEYEHNRAQIESAMNEAKMVLEDLGEEVEL